MHQPQITIREAALPDAPALARVLVDTTRIAFRHFMPRSTLLAFTHEESQHNWARTLAELAGPARAGRCLYVAEDLAGQAAGLAMGGPESSNHPGYAGEVLVLVVSRAYQRQGIGRRLVGTVAATLLREGRPSLLIRVVEPNVAARRFYEALGGQLVPGLREQIDDGGTTLAQIAYGWPDARTLV